MSSGATAPLVAGVDFGSRRTPSHVAWLAGDEVWLGAYLATGGTPLPPLPDHLRARGTVRVYAFDAPQGLPAAARGPGRRACDRAVNAPTRNLPEGRAGLAAMRAYGAFVEGGVDLFWQLHDEGLAHIDGLADDPGEASRPIACETYPRRILADLLGVAPARLPSKRADTRHYVGTVVAALAGRGVRFVDPGLPHLHDHADAALCALAARAVATGAAHRVGEPPRVDRPGRVLREGYVVLPGPGAR